MSRGRSATPIAFEVLDVLGRDERRTAGDVRAAVHALVASLPKSWP